MLVHVCNYASNEQCAIEQASSAEAEQLNVGKNDLCQLAPSQQMEQRVQQGHHITLVDVACNLQVVCEYAVKQHRS